MSITVGPWVIDPIARTVESERGIRRLEPKPMAMLLHLVAHVGEVVPRQDLLNAGWGSDMATDDVLSRAISELRRAIGDDRRDATYLQTIRGVGYRLAVPDAPPVSKQGPGVLAARRWSGQAPRLAALCGAGLLVVGLAIYAARAADQRPSSVDAHLVAISTVAGEEAGPRLSPDGTRLAYAWSDSLQSPSRVFVRVVLGGDAVPITDQHSRMPAWSPDGSEIAFLASKGRGWTIDRVSSLGGVPRPVTQGPIGPVLGMDWSPDGHEIVFSAHSAPFAPFQLNAVSLDSSSGQQLTNGGGGAVGDAFPVFSPDGRYVAFARFFTETSADVYILPTHGGPERRLTFDQRDITALAFAPDAAAVDYAYDRDGGSVVRRVFISGGRTQRVVSSDRRITGLTYPRVRAGGLIVSASEQEQHLWALAPNGSARPKPLPASTREDGLPSLSPNGERLAFISNRSGAAELWMAASRGDSARQLTRAGGFASVPSWSPDGRQLVVERQGDSETEVWVVDVEQRATRIISRAPRWPVAPTWSRDGRYILVGSRQSGDWEIWRVSAADTGRAVMVTDHGGIRAFESPDGRTLFLTKPRDTGLWSRDLASGKERLAVGALIAGDWTNWSLGTRSVYFVDRDTTGAQRVVAASLADGSTRVVMAPVRIPMGRGGLTVSLDETRVIFGQLDRRVGNTYRLADR